MFLNISRRTLLALVLLILIAGGNSLNAKSPLDRLRQFVGRLKYRSAQRESKHSWDESQIKSLPKELQSAIASNYIKCIPPETPTGILVYEKADMFKQKCAKPSSHSALNVHRLVSMFWNSSYSRDMKSSFIPRIKTFMKRIAFWERRMESPMLNADDTAPQYVFAELQSFEAPLYANMLSAFTYYWKYEFLQKHVLTSFKTNSSSPIVTVIFETDKRKFCVDSVRSEHCQNVYNTPIAIAANWVDHTGSTFTAYMTQLLQISMLDLLVSIANKLNWTVEYNFDISGWVPAAQIKFFTAQALLSADHMFPVSSWLFYNLTRQHLTLYERASCAALCFTSLVAWHSLADSLPIDKWLHDVLKAETDAFPNSLESFLQKPKSQNALVVYKTLAPAYLTSGQRLFALSLKLKTQIATGNIVGILSALDEMGTEALVCANVNLLLSYLLFPTSSIPFLINLIDNHKQVTAKFRQYVNKLLIAVVMLNSRPSALEEYERVILTTSIENFHHVLCSKSSNYLFCNHIQTILSILTR